MAQIQTEQAIQLYTPIPGYRILTPSDRLGVVQPYPWEFPGYTLVKFVSEGATYWIRTESMRPVPPDWKPPKKRGKK